jgi:signal transduction histidine kinase
VVAHIEGGSAAASPARGEAQAQRTQSLATALRAAASWAAEQVGGGICLVFAAAPGDGSPEGAERLRAAAGFASAQAARDAAQAVLPLVRETLRGSAPRQIDAPRELAERAKLGLRLLPLVFESRTHGLLLVGLSTPLPPGCGEVLANLAAQLGVRLDHAQLAEELAHLRATPAAPGDPARGDELLKLSEALFAQDIELLRSNEKLGKIEKLKNDFIEKMSRELRTPLNHIIESIIGVLTGENEALSEAGKASLREALDQGTAFLRTLQNILDLWRIKQRELPIEIQDVNFPEMVEEAIFSVQDAMGRKSLRLAQRLQQPFPKLRTDLAKVGQILFLLLDNAVKFTPAGEIEIMAKVEDGQLKCSIKDTGIGICPDDQQFIFDEFYQVDDSATARTRGAGLGLTLVRDLVTLLGGELNLKSEVGIGTRIAFQIPVQSAP